jgi:MFS family permease
VIPRNVKVLSWVSFFQDAASELLYPIMPLFLTATLGASTAVVGLVEGVAEGTAAVGKAVSGRLADRMRRKPLIAAGYGISSVAKPVIGLAGGWPLVLAARFVDRVGKGVRTSPRDALIAADTPPALRGAAFGLHRAADTAGAVLGPLLGLALYELLDHRLRPLFFVAFVPAAASVALIALVRERPAAASPAPAAPRLAAPRAPLPEEYRRAVALLCVFGLLNFSDAFLILRAHELGLGFEAVIGAYALYNAVYAALSYPAGSLSDRVGRTRILAAGLAVFALAYIGLGLADSSGWVWALFPLYGAYTALTDGVGKAWISDLLPTARLGSGLGLFQALTGLCALVAGVWAGLAWGGDGRVPLLISGAGAAVVALGLAIRPPASRRST